MSVYIFKQKLPRTSVTVRWALYPDIKCVYLCTYLESRAVDLIRSTFQHFTQTHNHVHIYINISNDSVEIVERLFNNVSK